MRSISLVVPVLIGANMLRAAYWGFAMMWEPVLPTPRRSE